VLSAAQALNSVKFIDQAVFSHHLLCPIRMTLTVKRRIFSLSTFMQSGIDFDQAVWEILTLTFLLGWVYGDIARPSNFFDEEVSDKNQETACDIREGNDWTEICR
jgi:hypothetical protein